VVAGIALGRLDRHGGRLSIRCSFHSPRDTPIKLRPHAPRDMHAEGETLARHGAKATNCEDQRAINAIVGKPVRFCAYDDIGRAELEFDDPFDPRTENYSHTHTIWVDPQFVERRRATKVRAKQSRTRLKGKTQRSRKVTGQKVAE
jgi:hypothetical protein